jgi:hypothetical protein
VISPDGRESIHVPGMPPEALPRTLAANGLLADVVVSKLVDHLPVYRQVNRHARQGMVDPNHWTVSSRFLASEIPQDLSLVSVTQTLRLQTRPVIQFLSDSMTGFRNGITTPLLA